MRILLIADIHSNKPAFEEVINHAGRVDRILCAGDVVGYNPYPNECVQIVRELNIECVMGNHDWASALDTPTGFNPYAQAAVHYTHRLLSRDNLNFLSGLPERLELEVEGVRLCMYHGSPRDPLNEYILPWTPKSTLRELLDRSSGDVLILGHTHIPMAYRLGDRYVINPGSVGQPRSRNPNSSYIILTIHDGNVEVEHRLVGYDIETVAKRIIEAGLPRFLADRLYLGV
ncbi:MAG: metallophosphoesterase family protein [Candidatus Bathyarchaeia archaeon]